jgi:hypothetical protein
MDPAAISVRLAPDVVAPLIKQLFVTEGPGAGPVDRPVRILALVSFQGERRTLTERDLTRIAATVVEEALRGDHPDEERAVTDALARALHALGTVDMDDVQAVRLGP